VTRYVQRNPYIGAELLVLAAILLDLGLPERLTLGPTWLLPSVEALLLVGLVVASREHEFTPSIRRRQLALGMIGLVSAVNVWSLGLLVHELLQGRIEASLGHALILAGVVLWGTNVMLFGLWYWELDRGGPAERAHRTGSAPDFMFPQMTNPELASEGWTPGLLDYLYVSFTNATAFSPTDAMPLSWTAKSLMSAQALTSLVTVGLVVARAVNILH
jgi:hypothetical protein